MKAVLLLCATVLSVVVYTQAAKIDILKEEYEKLGTKVDFYEDEYQNGLSTHVELVNGECKNLPKRWLKRAKSADTRGTCAQVCEEKDCKGACKRIYPNNGDQQLKTVEFAKRISSVKGCFV